MYSFLCTQIRNSTTQFRQIWGILRFVTHKPHRLRALGHDTHPAPVSEMQAPRRLDLPDIKQKMTQPIEHNTTNCQIHREVGEWVKELIGIGFMHAALHR